MKKVSIKVFVTKHYNFRARIKEPEQIPYEVTVGGNSWRSGKGLKYSEEINKKIGNILNTLFDAHYSEKDEFKRRCEDRKEKLWDKRCQLLFPKRVSNEEN